MLATIETIYQRFLEHPLVSTDSRQVQPGSLFFALKGDSFDGNNFAFKALQLGASYAIADNRGLPDDLRLLRVENVLSTLQQLALHHRKKFNIPVLAITGTNGKTTTKELACAVLSKKYQTLATQGNFNNHIGVPLTLLRLRPETEIAIVEMGANHPGEIDFLCQIARPQYGLITNIGKAHLEGFGNFEGVINTKTELYRFIQAHGLKVFVHSDNSLLMEHSAKIDRITYGTTPSFLTAKNGPANPFISLELFGPHPVPFTVQSQLYGRYNLPNLLAAACIGTFFDVNPEMIRNALENYRPANNRSQILKTAENTLILDAYNANPDSMAAALSSFAETAWPEKVVLLGDMLELGTTSDEEHRRILDLLDQYRFQQVFLVGETFTRLNVRRENICFHDSELARLWLDHHRFKNATVLIKGSRAIKLETVMGAIS